MKSCMTDAAHDVQHVRRVLYNALEIAKTESGVAYDVLIAACLLHDIGRREQFADPSLCHAAVGSEKAYRFLMENGFAPAFAEQVRQCIRTHRWRKSDPPQSLEAKILFDADKLDVVGATGIARALLYKGAVAEPLYSLRSDGTVSDGTQDTVPSFFREYRFKLEKLYDGFYTKRGKDIALQRRQAAVDFCDSLYREVSVPYRQGKETLQSLLRADTAAR